MQNLYSLSCILSLALTGLTVSAEAMTLGRVETGLIGKDCIPMHVKMDTGAKTSSVSAHNIKISEKKGKKWVTFVLDPDRTPALYRLELPLTRMVKIRKRAAETKNGEAAEAFERRPVVKLPLTLGTQTHEIEVSLADRSYFNYGMILGRSAMHQFNAVIDPKLSYSQKSICPIEKNSEH